MYSEKETVALLKAYKKHGGDMSAESFIKSVEKEASWDEEDKRPAVFGKTDDNEEGYLVKMEMMFNVPNEELGVHASEEEVIEEFKKINPWIVGSIERDEQIMVFKNGDINNRAFVGITSVEEKAPSLPDPDMGKEESERYELMIKKITYDDDTWGVMTYEVTDKGMKEALNVPYCLDALLSSLATVIRSTGDLQSQYMKKTMDGLNALYVDASIGEKQYKKVKKS